VKYAYLRGHWGQDPTTEAVAGLLRYGAEVHGQKHIVATTAPGNKASHRVLLKAGMTRRDLQDNADGSQTQWFACRYRI
jgi:RimJ/RimL family protein N-acetyltransferase